MTTSATQRRHGICVRIVEKKKETVLEMCVNVIGVHLRNAILVSFL